MRKLISALLLLIAILTLGGLNQAANAQVAIGSRSEEVKMIQEILKTDPNVYPEGYVTGYYGPLTANAVKRLQKRCGLPETGILDETTESCIYPINYEVKVLYPNGGEVLDRNQIHTIKWDVISPPGIAEIAPFWPKASIDLFRKVAATIPCLPGEACNTEKSIFVRHIATVNLFDKAWTYYPKSTSDVPNGSDYVIRISTGEGIVPIWEQEIKTAPGAVVPVRSAEIWPVTTLPSRWIYWDESDGTFEITGEITPGCPTCPAYPNLNEVIKILEKMIAELQRAIALLK